MFVTGCKDTTQRNTNIQTDQSLTSHCIALSLNTMQGLVVYCELAFFTQDNLALCLVLIVLVHIILVQKKIPSVIDVLLFRHHT